MIFKSTGGHMQVFSSDVYFTVGTNALLASQKEYYSDLVALLILDIRSLLLMSINTEISNQIQNL